MKAISHVDSIPSLDLVLTWVRTVGAYLVYLVALTQPCDQRDTSTAAILMAAGLKSFSAMGLIVFFKW